LSFFVSSQVLVPRALRIIYFRERRHALEAESIEPHLHHVNAAAATFPLSTDLPSDAARESLPPSRTKEPDTMTDEISLPAEMEALDNYLLSDRSPPESMDLSQLDGSDREPGAHPAQ
jgi:hypothetical protein